MKKHNYILFYYLLNTAFICAGLMFAPLSVYAQDESKQGVDLVKIAMENFPKNHAGLHWVKDMSGFLDNRHAVRMVLVTDNRDFHGCYQLKSSGEIFLLEGEFAGNEIILNEINDKGRVTGVIKGDMNDNAFYCEWSDIKNLERLTLDLFENDPYTSPSGNIGWLKYSKGNASSLSQVTITKSGEEKHVSFLLNKKRYSFLLECNDLLCQQLYAENNAGGQASSVKIQFDINTMTVSFVTDEINEKLVAIIDKSLTLDCLSYADYCHRSDVIYPVSKSKKFNAWVKEKLIPFEHKCGENIVVNDEEGTSTINRFVRIAHGSLKIDMFTDSLFSGMFVFESSDSHEIIEKPFIYDLIRDKEITLSDFYISELDAKQTIASEVKLRTPKLFADDDLSYFRTTKFDLISLCADGFICRNAFNTMYGQQKVIIPFSRIQALIKPKSKYKLHQI